MSSRWCGDKESTCQCKRGRRHGFRLWVGKIVWKRKWQPPPVFLPGKFHGQRSLVGYSPWGHRELDITEHKHTHADYTGITFKKDPKGWCLHTDAAAPEDPEQNLTVSNVKDSASYNSKPIIIMSLIWIGSNQLKTAKKNTSVTSLFKWEQEVRECVCQVISLELMSRKSIYISL